MTPSDSGPRVVTLLGTNRPRNYTAMALRLVQDEFQRLGIPVTAFDPATMDLPFPGRPVTADAKTMQEAIRAATGVVIATPEYHGSFPSMLKLMIENMDFPSVLSGKPVALMGVAAGRIGAIKSLEQLRGVCSHVGALVLPSAVSVANVQQVFDADGTCRDASVEKMLRGVAANLLDYIHVAVCPRMTLEAMIRGEPSPAAR